MMDEKHINKINLKIDKYLQLSKVIEKKDKDILKEDKNNIIILKYQNLEFENLSEEIKVYLYLFFDTYKKYLNKNIYKNDEIILKHVFRMIKLIQNYFKEFYDVKEIYDVKEKLLIKLNGSLLFLINIYLEKFLDIGKYYNMNIFSLDIYFITSTTLCFKYWCLDFNLFNILTLKKLVLIYLLEQEKEFRFWYNVFEYVKLINKQEFKMVKTLDYKLWIKDKVLIDWSIKKLIYLNNTYNTCLIYSQEIPNL